MAEELLSLGYNLVSNGTDTHVILIDLSNKNISGKSAEKALESSGITVNKNMVPFDSRSPFITSGIRIGTPAITTRDMGQNEMKKIVSLIDDVINNHDDNDNLNRVRNEVINLCESFPIYKELSK